MLTNAAPLERLFLHFFDIHFLDEVVAQGASDERVKNEARLALRLALMAAGEVLVPAASYLESDLCREVVDEFAALFERGGLWLVGGGANVYEFAETKLSQYPTSSEQFKRYVVVGQQAGQYPPFRSRSRSSTEDLGAFWTSTLNAPDFPRAVFGAGTGIELPSDLESAWSSVPERLGTQAFVADYVQPLMFPQGAPIIVRNRLHGVINEGYFESYAQEMDAGLVVDLVALGSGHALRSGSVDLPYRKLREILRNRAVLEDVVTAAPETLIDLRQDTRIAQALTSVAVDEIGPSAYDLRALQLPLSDTPDLLALLNRLLNIRPGKRGATAYHRASADLLSVLFQYSLTDRRIEEPIDEGRKRIDITYRNMGRDGFFRWIAMHERFGGAPYIVCECKNYTSDPGNAELDQLTGRFSPWRGRFGILLCRSLRNRERFVERCRDAATADRGWVIPLDDHDLIALVEAGIDPRWTGRQSPYLAARLDAVAR